MYIRIRRPDLSRVVWDNIKKKNPLCIQRFTFGAQTVLRSAGLTEKSERGNAQSNAHVFFLFFRELRYITLCRAVNTAVATTRGQNNIPSSTYVYINSTPGGQQ
jgi:hypothetical protein